MARSSNIYIVLQDNEIKGAFTVKHEMCSTLPNFYKTGLKIIRVQDGCVKPRIEDITLEVYKIC